MAASKTVHGRQDYPWWSETQGSTGQVHRGWGLLKKNRTDEPLTWEEQIGPHWYVFRRPDAFFSVPDDM